MNALRRIFGLGPAAMPKRPDHIEYMTDNGSTRLRYVDDTTASAIAARHNFSMIYGAANLPANFGMRGVIEVKQNDGVWTPVSGTSAFVPDMESQMAALQAYKETGIIGAQPVNAQGTLAGPGGTDGEATGAAGGGGGGAASAAAGDDGLGPVMAPLSAAQGSTGGQQHPAIRYGATDSGASAASVAIHSPQQSGLDAAQQMLMDGLPAILKNMSDQRRDKAAQTVLDRLFGNATQKPAAQPAQPEPTQQPAVDKTMTLPVGPAGRNMMQQGVAGEGGLRFLMPGNGVTPLRFF